jgi:hypothetical protein
LVFPCDSKGSNPDWSADLDADEGASSREGELDDLSLTWVETADRRRTLHVVGPLAAFFDRRAAGTLAVLAALLGILLYNGFSGLDFGGHWDENVPLNLATWAYTKGNLLPHWYLYPSMIYVLTLICSVPAFVMSGFQPDVVGAYMSTNEFLHFVRGVYFGLAALTGIWAFVICRQIGLGMAAGVAAFSLVGFSHEFTYHSRWITTDPVVAQFGALTFVLSLAYMRHQGTRRRRLLVLASISAGFTMATKYTGGLVILPLWTTLAIAHRGDARTVWKSLALSAAVFIAAFVAITPGVVLDAGQAFADIRSQLAHYKGGHFGHTVRAGRAHLSLMLDYFVHAAFSHFDAIAMIVFGFSLVGMAVTCVKARDEFLVLFPFAALYVVYFSSLRVMFVRNLLIVFPVLAVFAAAGGLRAIRLS